MATITVRNLPPEVQRKLKQRAADNNRSMEAEARAILAAAVAERRFSDAWVRAMTEFGGADIALPERSAPRPVDL
jgi:antitoxin FitA